MSSTSIPRTPPDSANGGPRSNAPRTSSLPLPRTSFVGRDRDVTALTDLLVGDSVRLVTVIGPGGVGKTRLAVETADRLHDHFPDGIWFVGLAPLDHADLVASGIAYVLGVRETLAEDALAPLVEELQGRNVLLILDNFEHLIDAGLVVADLLVRCLNLTILVTSREVLRLSGEHVYWLRPMPLSDAVPLFVTRAKAATSDFELTDENSGAISAICRHLDGLPLAIELAAARVPAFPPVSLLFHLGDRLLSLNGGPRDQPSRLRSMRDAIAWSYDLLSEQEQADLRRLSVFSGSWTLDAAEAVAGAEVEIGEMGDRLASLIDKSMLQRAHENSGHSRFTMLATVREFAFKQLEAHSEVDTHKQSHAAYFLKRAEACVMADLLPDGLAVLNRMNAEDANLRSALTWFAESCDAESLLNLAFQLCSFWEQFGRIREAREWLGRAVEMGRAAQAPSLAKGLVTLGGVVHVMGDESWGSALVAEGLDFGHDSASETRFLGLTFAGLVSLRLNDLATSASFQKRALTMLAGVPDAPWQPFAVSTVLGHLGNIAVAGGEIEIAERYFVQALDLQRERGYEPGTSHFTANHPIAGLGDVARARGDFVAALDAYQTGIRHAYHFHDYRAVVYAMGGLAGTLAMSGAWRPAARLFGASEALHLAAGIHFELETMDRQRALGLPEPWLRADKPFGAGQPLRDALKDRAHVGPLRIPDPQTAERLWSQGRTLSFDEAVAESLQVTALGQHDCGSPSDAAVQSSGLTRRERDVLRLVVSGHANREIADRLYISVPTVKRHITTILGKLGVSSRLAAAAYARANDLV